MSVSADAAFLIGQVQPCQLQLSNSRQQHDKTPGHPGMSHTKSVARSYLWWPGLDKELDECAELCLLPSC